MTAQTTEELVKIYESYLAGLKAKRFEAAIAPLAKEVQASLRKEYPTRAKQAAFFDSHAPASHEAVGITRSKSGEKATVYFIGAFPMPKEMQEAANLPPKMRPRVLRRVSEGSGCLEDGR